MEGKQKLRGEIKKRSKSYNYNVVFFVSVAQYTFVHIC